MYESADTAVGRSALDRRWRARRERSLAYAECVPKQLARVVRRRGNGKADDSAMQESRNAGRIRTAREGVPSWVDRKNGGPVAPGPRKLIRVSIGLAVIVDV